MTPKNKRHLKRVLYWGGGLSALAAVLSLLKFPPVVAASIMTGAALGIFNLYSIVRLVEVLADVASSGPGSGKAVKVFTGIAHAFKLTAVFGVLFMLVYLKLTNLFALLAGFTVVLAVNVLAGLSGLKDGAEGQSD